MAVIDLLLGNRALRAAGVRPRGPYHTRHTSISVALRYGANIKWLAAYCGTSLEMIEQHYEVHPQRC